MHAPVEIRDMSESELPALGWGPKMAALASDKQRAFCVEMFRVAPGKGAPTRAAIAAGYGSPTSTPSAMRVIAYRLVNDERIQEALEEHGRKRFHELFPLALNSLESLLKNKNHKDHGRAVMGVVERLAPAEFHHKHEHEHQHRLSHESHEARSIWALRLLKKMGTPREGLVEFFGSNGLGWLEAKLTAEDAKLSGRPLPCLAP
jgi:hypothetical protein